MTKDKLKGLMAISILIILAGLFLLFNSVNLGISFAENWLSKEGDADTSLYHISVKGYINNFLAAGSIFLGVGLIMAISTYYKILTIKEEQIREKA